MRKLLLVLALGAILGVLFADSVYFTALPSAEVLRRMGEDDLYRAARAISRGGYEVYHYDSDQMLVGEPETSGLSFSGKTRLCGLPLTDRLYLISKLEDRAYPDFSAFGTVLLRLRNSVLLRSRLDEVGLRGRIAHPFTRLELVPIRFARDDMVFQALQETRTEIQQVLALVDSVVVESMIQSLQDFQTRYALAPNRLAVANWIRQQFINFGVPQTQLFNFTWNNTDQYNVVATIPGTVYPDQYIVVGGHHDSINNYSDPYVSAPGADDNGSGAVTALEMARVMMLSGYQPKTSIRFVTFAAEEFGLWGSKAYATWADNEDLNIRLMMNHDMVANSSTGPPDWEVRLMPYDGSLDHSAYALQITEQYTTLNSYYGSSNSASSDSHPFWQHGYNVIYYFESEFSPYYHSSNDIVANLNPSYCAEVIKASTAVAMTFADMPAAPTELVVQDTGTGNSLYASWQGYDDPTISHYNVYHSATMGQWGTPAVTTDTLFTVTGLTEGQLHYIAVSTVDTFGNESYLIYGAGVPYSIPLSPYGLTDQPLLNSISLIWDENQELDLAGYKLYRSQTEGELGTLLTPQPITENSFEDHDVLGSADIRYYYSLCAVDQDGNASPYTEQVWSRPMTLNQGILVVDETADLSGATPFQPTDQQVDDFYDSILEDTEYDQLDLAQLTEDMKLADIGIYSSILWHGNDVSTMDYPWFVRDALQQYLTAGGQIMLSLYMPSLAFELNSTYPTTFSPGSFINSVIGIESAQYSNTARFKQAWPQVPVYPILEVDPDKIPSSLNGHIPQVEAIQPNPASVGIYRYESDYEDDSPQGFLNDLPVAVFSNPGAGKVLTLSFPLYYMHTHEARNLVEHVFGTIFGESFVPVDDPYAPAVAGLSIGSNQPNPFGAATQFRIELKDERQPLVVGIYNLRGQLVNTLFSGPGAKSAVYQWDGRDSAGAPAASGVYFIRAQNGDQTALRRILLIRG